MLSFMLMLQMSLCEEFLRLALKVRVCHLFERALAGDRPALYASATVFSPQVIHSTHHTVRLECLNLIGRLGQVTLPDVGSPLVRLEEYVSDNDPRVRSAAFHALV